MEIARDDIKMFSKSLLLKSFHKYLRLWFISGNLDASIACDPDIKPYITPCSGHATRPQSLISHYDEIDGVLPMEAYCFLCQSRKSGTCYGASWDIY